MGGVLIAPDKCLQHLGVALPGALATRWASEACMKSEHVIGQAELLPVLAALFIWADLLRAQRALVFIDNDAARYGLIGGRNHSMASLPIVGEVGLHVARLGLFPWYERVPGPCNLADGPSRLQFREVESLGSVQVPVQAFDEGLSSHRGLLEWPVPLRPH